MDSPDKEPFTNSLRMAKIKETIWSESNEVKRNLEAERMYNRCLSLAHQFKQLDRGDRL